MPVHRKRQRARIPKNKPKRKRAFTTVRRDGRECALFSAHSAGAPPTARSHAACSTPLYFAESTRVLAAQYSSTSRKVLSNTPQRIPPFSAPRHSPVKNSRRDKGAAHLIRRTKRIRTQTRSLLGGHRKRPITPNQPHAPLGTNHLPRSVSVTKPLPGIRSTPAPPLLRPQEAHVRFATAPKMPCRNNSETRYYDYWPKMSHEKPKTPFKTFAECLILRKKS